MLVLIFPAVEEI